MSGELVEFARGGPPLAKGKRLVAFPRADLGAIKNATVNRPTMLPGLGSAWGPGNRNSLGDPDFAITGAHPEAHPERTSRRSDSVFLDVGQGFRDRAGPPRGPSPVALHSNEHSQSAAP
eukprot:2199189-Pyramimonas_sp.AAC.1